MSKRNAIVLAAGVGSRLRPFTENFPKCMVEVNHQTLINRLLTQLSALPNIDQIIVVSGYKFDLLSEYLAKYKHQNIVIIKNEYYDTTNNMYSLNLALEYTLNDSIIVNADCIYDDSIVKKIGDVHESTILFDSSHYSVESMKIKIVDCEIVDMSKSLDVSDSFSSIDLYYFKKVHLEKLKDIIIGYLNKGAKNLWSEVAIRELLQKNYGLIRHIDINGQKWFEIDDLNDLNLANKLFS